MFAQIILLLFLLESCSLTKNEDVNRKSVFYTKEKAQFGQSTIDSISISRLVAYNKNEGLIGVNKLLREMSGIRSECVSSQYDILTNYQNKFELLQDGCFEINSFNIKVYKYLELLHNELSSSIIDSLRYMANNEAPIRRIALIGILDAKANSRIDALMDTTILLESKDNDETFESDLLVQCMMDLNSKSNMTDWKRFIEVGNRCLSLTNNELNEIVKIKKIFGVSLYRSDFVAYNLESEDRLFKYLTGQGRFVDISRSDSIAIVKRNVKTTEILAQVYSERLLQVLRDDLMMITACNCIKRGKRSTELEELE
jgi:hypothetical protein